MWASFPNSSLTAAFLDLAFAAQALYLHLGPLLLFSVGPLCLCPSCSPGLLLPEIFSTPPTADGPFYSTSCTPRTGVPGLPSASRH